jgi:hypothetical protein
MFPRGMNNKEKAMTNEEIKEKYGIELIGKEMWVWDDDQEDAFLCFVIYKKPENEFRYDTIDKDRYGDIFKHASDTNPNEPQEPQVGDIGYFWDFQKAYAYGELIKIYENQTHKYVACTNSFFINFSKEKQPWMK